MLTQAGVPTIDEKLLLQGLLNTNNITPSTASVNTDYPNNQSTLDLGQSETDFIDAYNALTRSSPLLNMDTSPLDSKKLSSKSHKSSTNIRSPSKIGMTAGSSRKLEISSSSSPERLNYRTSSKSSKNKKDNLHSSKTTSSKVESNTSNVHKINSKVNEQNVNQNDRVDGKANNLNDIVDNTQRIIQQMKNEINSDINSLDDKITSRSVSEESSEEPDISSDETSFGASAEGSAGTSSSENGSYLSESRSTENNASNKQSPIVNRTSSEDTEQFEEAIDHIYVQPEDIQQSNIEMLDSIARSLQEEHTISFEKSSPKIIIQKKNQDHNNNFSSVSTFEEIYEGLHTNDIKRQLAPAIEKRTNNEGIILKSFKQDLLVKLYKPDELQNLVTTQSNYNVYNATIDYIEDSSTEDMLTENINQLAQLQNEIETLNINIEPIDNNKDIGEELNIQFNIKPISTINDISQETNVEFDESIDSDSSNVSDSENTPNEDIVIESTAQQDNSKEELNTTYAVIELQNISQVDNKGDFDEKSTTINQAGQSVSKPTVTNNQRSLMKSNIPKPVKSITNTKQKLDKTETKPISRVPVRRSSIKQYPAPSPPNPHFGNIQSGHVKQLQSRLLNQNVLLANGSNPVTKENPTLTKIKKQAPPPPPRNSHKLSTPPRSTPSRSTPPHPAKEPSPSKKQYFRETCGTEDEWSESEEENSQRPQRRESTEDQSVPSSSPPPPPTVRRVSGQIIDLANVRLPEGSPEVSMFILICEKY